MQHNCAFFNIKTTLVKSITNQFHRDKQFICKIYISTASPLAPAVGQWNYTEYPPIFLKKQIPREEDPHLHYSNPALTMYTIIGPVTNTVEHKRKKTPLSSHN